MKKLIVVSKTHLDLGFTDYAESIRLKYINEFIPNAVSLARQANKNGEKNFVWTTGSWILKEALENGTSEQRESLERAIRGGDIAPHALPFTMHTELLDEDTLDYGLTIVDKLDKLRGRKTTAAKMTDVPGHTKGLVKALSAHGIKLLHIGVNGASALPEVPECFLWKCGGSEVVVIYSGDYGGAFKSNIVDEILYFDHTNDNSGTPSPEKTLENMKRLRDKYPDYEVSAGTMDEFADIIWEKRNELPVIENEIGDTWIHGSASDPYKAASLRTLSALKRKWLADGSMKKGSEEYIRFSDFLLCIAEHTCGMDNKRYFADYEHYLKKDFNEARKADNVSLRRPFADFPQNLLTLIYRKFGDYKKGSYSVIEKSWAEQRTYIASALNALSDGHGKEARDALSELIPKAPEKLDGNSEPFKPYKIGNWKFSVNKNGGIKELLYNGESIIRSNDFPVLEYRSYSDVDYDFWKKHYTRDIEKTFMWSLGDFARPLLKNVRGRYPVGRFAYSAVNASCREAENEVRISLDLKCNEKLCSELGAPRLFTVAYTLKADGLSFDVSWFDKDASRLTEAIFLRLYPANGKLTLTKLGESIDPYSVVSKGGRNLHAVRNIRLDAENGAYRFINYHSPLVSVGRGKILEFDNKFEDFSKNGISFVLYDNVWGTNFPLWYEDNASFSFKITDEKAFNTAEF